MQVLGITGGIATGKSTITQMLAGLGAPTISADAIAHALLAPGTATTQGVVAVFPNCADPSDPARQTIDRRALGCLIFADPADRVRLEVLTHPAIIAALQEQIAIWRLSDQSLCAAAEIPLLFEAGLEGLADLVVVAACAEPLQISRLRARLGVSEEEARRLITAQWPLAEKIARADVVITTDGELWDTQRQVTALWETL